MIRKPNRKCLCCGKEYFFCMSCDDGRKTPWKTQWDNENCRDVFMTIADFKGGELTKEEAEKKLHALDLSTKASFKADVINGINEILGVQGKKDDSEVDVETKKASRFKR